MNLSYAYTEALIQILPQAESLGPFVQALKEFQTGSQNFKSFFKSPVYALEVKKHFIQKSMGGELSLSVCFLCVLLEKNHFSLLDDIVQRLHKKHQALQGVITARVISAQPLSPEEAQSLKAGLQAFFKKTIQIQEVISQAVLGGMRVEAGGFVFDGSLSFHLKQLKHQEGV